jgi:hypothetical protein
MCYRYRRLAAKIPSILWCCFLTAGCTQLEVVRRTPEGGWQKAPGLIYYAPKPYLLVYPLAGHPGTSWRIVYLPDPTETYSIYLKGWLGIRSYRFEMSEAGTLRSVTAGPAYQATLPEAPYLEKEVQAAFGASSSERLLIPAPGLYEIVVDPATRTFKSLRPIRIEPALLPDSSSPWGPRVREIRFETSSDRPQVVSAIVLDLDPPVPPPEKGACLPPGLEVVMLRDGTRIEQLCSPPLDCKTSGQEVRCMLSDLTPHSYFVRTVTSATVEGRRLDTVLGGRFPSRPEGLALHEPSAEVHFGMTSDGRVRTIAVQYDRHGGSCIDPKEPGVRDVLREERRDALRERKRDKGSEDVDHWTDHTKDRCELVSTLTLAPPAGDVSVAVIPRNAAGVYGTAVFASAPSEAVADARPVLNVTASANGSAQSTQTPTVSPPKGEPPTKDHGGDGPRNDGTGKEEPTGLIAAEGQLTNSRFSAFKVRFTASRETARRPIGVSGWWIPATSKKVIAKMFGERVISRRDNTTCAKLGVLNWTKLDRIRLSLPRTFDNNSDFETLISFPVIAEARLLCLELEFQRLVQAKRVNETHVITVDESLLRDPPDPPSQNP